jgi:nitrogen fixation/metabolism regulation signal transduction histidine kinase
VTSKQKGTGLGLAIVKKIVEEHGGMIQAQNNEQGGATIIIRLPVVHAGEAAQSAVGD